MKNALLVVLTVVSFIITSIIGPVPVYAQDYRLPIPGVMVHLSPPLDPPMLKGIKVHPDNPLRFDFILDKGDSELSNVQLKEESSKLIKYFLASLTIPEKDLWVNLSPYEKDRIIPQSFGLTEMGRDLLGEDYMLKQITASLIYPEDKVGKKFWKHIYEEAQKRYGTTNVPVNTFNKVWIVPEKAVVYENAKTGTAYVVESKLKVMLEQDYLSLEKHEGIQTEQSQAQGTNQLGSQIVREIVIPELTKEVNENKNFARLRQVYNSLILATWYKNKIKDSILEQVYADKNKVAGVNIDDPEEKEKIYRQYLRAFKKGVYNYIKEDIDPVTQETIPRKYFSGGLQMGFDLGHANMAMAHLQVVTEIPDSSLLDNALLVKETTIPDIEGYQRNQSRSAGLTGDSKEVDRLQHFLGYENVNLDSEMMLGDLQIKKNGNGLKVTFKGRFAKKEGGVEETIENFIEPSSFEDLQVFADEVAKKSMKHVNTAYLLPKPLTLEEQKTLASKISGEMLFLQLDNNQMLVSFGGESEIKNVVQGALTFDPNVRIKYNIHNHPFRETNPERDDGYGTYKPSDNYFAFPSHTDELSAQERGNVIFNAHNVVVYRVHPNLLIQRSAILAASQGYVLDPTFKGIYDQYAYFIAEKFDKEKARFFREKSDRTDQEIVKFFESYGVFVEVMPWGNAKGKSLDEIVQSSDGAIDERIKGFDFDSIEKKIRTAYEQEDIAERKEDLRQRKETIDTKEKREKLAGEKGRFYVTNLEDEIQYIERSLSPAKQTDRLNELHQWFQKGVEAQAFLDNAMKASPVQGENKKGQGISRLDFLKLATLTSGAIGLGFFPTNILAGQRNSTDVVPTDKINSDFYDSYKVALEKMGNKVRIYDSPEEWHKILEKYNIEKDSLGFTRYSDDGQPSVVYAFKDPNNIILSRSVFLHEGIHALQRLNPKNMVSKFKELKGLLEKNKGQYGPLVKTFHKVENYLTYRYRYANEMAFFYGQIRGDKQDSISDEEYRKRLKSAENKYRELNKNRPGGALPDASVTDLLNVWKNSTVAQILEDNRADPADEFWAFVGGYRSINPSERRDIINKAGGDVVDLHNLVLDFLEQAPKQPSVMKEIKSYYQGLGVPEKLFHDNAMSIKRTNATLSRNMLFSRSSATAKYGGIDLTPANMNLQTKNAREGIKFHLNPAMLQQLQNAPGFVPVIISIQPMTNIKAFLGIQETDGMSQVGYNKD